MKKTVKKMEYSAPELEIACLYSNIDLLEGSINDWIDDPDEIN